MNRFGRWVFGFACVALLIVACSSRKNDAAPAPTASTAAPPPAPPPAPVTCTTDSDCVPLNCCFAQTEHSCIPKGRANCDKFAIVCDDAGPGYACTCEKGACLGKWSMGGPPPGPGGHDAGPYALQMQIASGALSTSAVLDVIIKHGPDVRACHARSKKEAGLLTLSWNVQPTGKPDKPLVMSSTALDPKLVTCLTKKIAGWRFPKAKGPTRVSYAFRFTRS